MNVLSAFHGQARDPRSLPNENPWSSNFMVKLSLNVAARLYTSAGNKNQKLIMRKNHMMEPVSTANDAIFLR